jgi:hypothetical protein
MVSQATASRASKLQGKRVKNNSGAPMFKVHKMSKDLGNAR